MSEGRLVIALWWWCKPVSSIRVYSTAKASRSVEVAAVDVALTTFKSDCDRSTAAKLTGRGWW